MNRLLSSALLLTLLFSFSGCQKVLDLSQNPPPPGTLILEFAKPVKNVIELKIDGEPLPIRFGNRNRFLIVEGLKPGVHDYNITSISYVFGPEYNKFRLDNQKGAYYFIQQRRYRSALPNRKSEVSMRAYRKELKRRGIDMNEVAMRPVRAYFVSHWP